MVAAPNEGGHVASTLPCCREGKIVKTWLQALLHVTLGGWLALDSGYANIASVYAPKGFGLSRSGCPTCGRQNLSRKLTASRLPSPPANTRPTTKHSSTRSPS